MIDSFWQALTFTAGYNTTLVTLGSAMLGASAGMIGSFIVLRKRSLVSDAVSHATLPGLVLAFIILALLTGDGRWLPGLLIGAAASAAIGLWGVQAISSRTRLGEDAAIGAVLSTLFGLGVVLITVVQALNVKGQSGIDSYLVGATAGMLASEAQLIGISALVVLIVVFMFRRQFLLVCFDRQYAYTRGINADHIDMMMLLLLLTVTVIGLKVTGLILIVALTIIPPVTGRFWTDRPSRLIAIAALCGALSGYIGAAASSSASGLPTGPLIVLTAFLLFSIGLLFSPRRGMVAMLLAQHRFRRRVHLRQGLLSLARDEAIYDDLTLKVLRRHGYIRRDGVATPPGRVAARDAEHEEHLWSLYRQLYPDEAAQLDHQGLDPIEESLPPDMVSSLENRLPSPARSAR
ncbi:metal ABC transporter permease [Aidingimonas halophila]|uniref:Manganese/zinc/iron transport system permease protein n=1 Tax=Aidingimonas halophila TaxID=574349 RepID=A0A1H3F3B7_9GAMM|nr:metal ABC transporter permease [Aidingimonas halophila]GHC32151.1 manganese ABC transporter permease [Aidingimonas halophila]SDX84689.1 manganese/zinc/iron transport system permease protein [Aidingimonas halophila]